MSLFAPCCRLALGGGYAEKFETRTERSQVPVKVSADPTTATVATTAGRAG